MRLMVPVTPVRSSISGPLALPAAHSPATEPEATSVFAAVIASRRVHKPSVLFETLFEGSTVLLTIMVLPAGVMAG